MPQLAVALNACTQDSMRYARFFNNLRLSHRCVSDISSEPRRVGRSLKHVPSNRSSGCGVQGSMKIRTLLLAILIVGLPQSFAFGQRGSGQRDKDKEEKEVEPVCSAEARWTNAIQTRRIPRDGDAVLNVSLLSAVSEPAATCLGAQVHLVVTYIDHSENVICSGSVDGGLAANQVNNVQTFNFEIHPFRLREFVIWHNVPGTVGTRLAKRLRCTNFAGTAEVAETEMGRVAAIRITAIVLPRRGGIATAEVLVGVGQ